MRPVELVDISVDLPATYPVVVLRELDPPYRELRFALGLPEGAAIAYAWRSMTTPRPLTHDLFATVLERFEISLELVSIVAVEGRTFFAEVTFRGSQPGSQTIECRPSDALALALRQRLPVPIVVAEDVLDCAGVAVGEPTAFASSASVAAQRGAP